MRILLRAATVLFLCGWFAQPALAQQRDFRIQAQDAASALTEFARQANRQILFKSDRLKGVKTNALSGQYEPSAAIALLLKDTGLRAWTREGNVLVVDVERTGSANGPGIDIGEMRLADASYPAQAADPQTPPQTEPTTGEPQTDRAEAGGELLVTGSRIRGPQQTGASVTVIDRETIERRGFSTVEDIIRSLPQSLSTMNAARSVTQPVGGDGLTAGPAAQGEVTANLRGLGHSATLVLINGRRTAGSAAFAGAAVNLASIPVASIERVEILPDSAAAVYGSDAIAGVINIILREDFRGASSSVRAEDAANGGDKWAVDQVLGYGWGSGNITATLSWSETKPIVTERTGYVTNDLRYLGGYDTRNSFFAQNGFVLDENFNPLGSLPQSFDGTENWTIADLTEANLEAARGDWVPRDQSSETDTRAVYVNVKQQLSDSVDGFFGLRYSQDKVKALGSPPLLFVSVSEDNIYNRLGVPLFVAYVPDYETRAGLIPVDYSANTLRSLAFEGGVGVDLPVRDWRADISAVHSISKSRSSGARYPGSFASSPLVQDTINVFGNGTAQNLDLFLDAITPGGYTDRRTTLSGLTALAEGGLLDLAAGSLRGVLGTEYRIEALDFGEGDYLANDTEQGNGITDLTPEQSIMAFFAETRIPLMTDLTASLQGRWERYDVKSSDAIIDGKTFSKFSPRVGLVWDATSSLAVRGSWGRAFKAPNLTQLVVIETLGTFQQPVDDPIEGQEDVPVYVDRVANPGLTAETGETINLGFDWRPTAIPGLRASLTYNRTEFSNRIVGSILGVPGLSRTDILADPESYPGVAVRDPVTNELLRMRTFPYNISEVQVDGIDLDLLMVTNTAGGEFRAGLTGTYTLKYQQRAAPGLATTELQGTTYADRFVAVTSLGWSRGGYGVDVYGHFTNAYWNTELPDVIFDEVVEPMRVRSRTTWDVSGYFDFGAGWRVSAGVRNLFDEEFPFHQGFAGPYDTRRVDLRGRLMFGEIRKEFSF